MNFCAEVPAAALLDAETSDRKGCKTDDYGSQDYRDVLKLKDDHNSRPLWIVCFDFFCIAIAMNTPFSLCVHFP